ncbi:MAG: proline racemase family protein [Gaiellaceae bacterium]
MKASRVITVVGCHAGGEIGNVVTGGVLPPHGETVFERMLVLRADDSLRKLLLREPRGSVAAHANLIVPSQRPDCAAGFIIMEPTEYPAMSGSNTICVATVLLETGMVEMREPETTLRLEAPAGVVEVTARCREGRCESVELTNVPCFADGIDAQLEVEGVGTITVDVAFGGMWYAIADAAALGFALEPAEARDLSRTGELIRRAAREQLPRVHPDNPEIAGISIVQIAEPWRGVGAVSRNAVIVAPGRLDRSATGTGLSARMAALHARGLMRPGDGMTHASVIGSTFDGRILSETTVGGRRAIVPAIRGSAWITGITQVFVDPDDPFPEGYLLTDTWPGSDEQA